jgi:hypothetical protein
MTFWTEDLSGCFEWVALNINFARIVDCSIGLDMVGDVFGSGGGIVVVRVRFSSFLLDLDCCRACSCHLLIAVSFENDIVDYVVEDIVEYGVCLDINS